MKSLLKKLLEGKRLFNSSNGSSGGNIDLHVMASSSYTPLDTVNKYYLRGGKNIRPKIINLLSNTINTNTV